MSFGIRKSYKNSLTVQMIKDFIKEEGYKIQSGINKNDMIDALESAVHKKEISSDIINEWINEILEIGPKHIYFAEVTLSENSDLLNNTEYNGYYNTFDIKQDFSSVYRKKESEIINLGLGISLYKENEGFEGSSTFYLPINVKYNKQRSDLVISFSSHKDLFFSPDCVVSSKVTESKLLNKLFRYLSDYYGVTVNRRYRDIFRKSIYRILEENSGLPDSIQNILLDVDTANTEAFLKTFESNYEIKVDFRESMEEDINNFIEKYICLSWDNQDDFTRNKKCYPYDISLKDRENTTLIQKSELNESLLTKSAYHDNKKTLKKEKMCEKIHMAYDDCGKKYKVIFSVVNSIGKIAYEKYLDKEAMNELIDDLICKYYDEKGKITRVLL